MKRGVKVRQHYDHDCGAASFASVAAWYGLRLSLEEIRQKSSTSWEGTTIAGLVAAAEAFGFEAGGFRGSPESLEKIDIPAILHLRKSNGRLHFAVSYGLRGRRFRLMDPEDGEIHLIKKEELFKIWSGYLVLIRRGNLFRPGDRRVSLFKALMDLVKLERLSLFSIILISLCFTIAALATSLIIKILTDSVIPSGNLRVLGGLAISVAFITILSFLMNIAKGRILLSTGLRHDLRISTTFIKHLLYLPQSFFDLRKTGDITSRISDSYKIRALITELPVSIAIAFMSFAVSLVVMFFLQPALAAAACLSIPLFVGSYLLFDKINRRYLRDICEESAACESFLNDTIRVQKSIKYFGLEEFYSKRGELVMSRLNEAIAKGSRGFLTGSSVTDLIGRLLTMSILFSGSLLVIEGGITTGDLLAFFTLLTLFSAPLAQVCNAGRDIREGLIAASRILEIEGIEPERDYNSIDNKDSNSMIPRNDFRQIVIDRISFAYPGRAPIINGLSVKIERGSVHLIVGENGSGKSTIASLLCRLYRPASGSICLDNTSIDDITIEKWRAFVGIVPQRLEILSDTLLENIVPGGGEIDFTRLEEIMKLLRFELMLRKMPGGLSTLLSQHSSVLSRGEQQRVAIARAIYRRPAILILDEATSSLDTESEEIIGNLILSLKKKGVTIIIISHDKRDMLLADAVTNLSVTNN